MECKLFDALKLKHNPVAIIWSNEKPDDALQFAKGKWGCVMMLFAQAAARGKCVAFDRETFGCLGGGTGLGFGNQYVNFEGGVECFCHFLSTGNKKWNEGEELKKDAKKYGSRENYSNYLEGEGYIKLPVLVNDFLDKLPIIEVPTEYVLLKPIKDVDENTDDDIQVVIFSVNPDQLSALIVLANYDRKSFETVYAPFVAGCQSIGIMTYNEIDKKNPRAIIGLTDLSARIYTSKHLGADSLTFAVPLKMFHEMESNIEGSFLEKNTWKKLVKMNMEK